MTRRVRRNGTVCQAGIRRRVWPIRKKCYILSEPSRLNPTTSSLLVHTTKQDPSGMLQDASVEEIGMIIYIRLLNPKVQRYPHYPKHASLTKKKKKDKALHTTHETKVQSSRLKQPLLDSTIPNIPPNTTKPSVLNGIQRRLPRSRRHVRNAGLAPAPLNNLIDLIQCRVPSIEPFSRSSLRRRITGEL